MSLRLTWMLLRLTRRPAAAAVIVVCLVLTAVVVAGATRVGQQGALNSEPADASDVAALLKEAKENTARNWAVSDRRRAEYTFRWRRTLRRPGGEGVVKEKSELMELYVPPGCRYGRCRVVSIKLEENGRPVAPEKIEKERLRAGRKLEQAEREAEKTAAVPSEETPAPRWMQFTYYTKGMFVKDRSLKIDGQEILEKCDFTSPRRETVGSREMIALDFAPRPGVAFDGQTGFMPQMEGRLWLDAADRLFVRLAAWPKGARPDEATSDELLRGAALAFDTVRVKEGFWMFRLGRVNGLKYPGVFEGTDAEFSIEISYYLRFAVEADKIELRPTEKMEQ